MKQFSLTILVLVLLSIASYGREKDKNAKLLNDLTTALKTANQSAFKTSGQYKTASFGFNGKTVNAFINPETDDLIGFAIHVTMNEMPIGTQASLDKKYPGFIVQDVLIFLNDEGNLTYFVSVSKPHGNKLALQIADNGKAHIYARMF